MQQETPPPPPPPPQHGVDGATSAPEYYEQATMYLQALATSAGFFYQDPNAYNNTIINSYYPTLQGVATNGYEQLVGAQVNSVSSRSEIIQPERCEVCKIECNSKEMLNSHKQGKKHNKNLEKLKASLAPAPVSPVVPNHPINSLQEQPEKKKPKANEQEDVVLKKKKVVESGTMVDAVKTCEVCNVVCNSEIVFQSHLDGKMHKKNMEKTEASLALVASFVPNNPIIGPQEKPKKTVESGTVVDAVKTSEVCNVVCNSELVSQNHLDGEKHKKNLEKTEASLAPVAPVVPNNSIIGPQEKPKKMVESGTMVDAVKTCEACNVVCNSELNFLYHLAGQKHKKNVEKQKTSLTPTPAPVAPVLPSNPIIGPQKKPKRKAKADEPEDLESKKNKIIKGGTAVDAVKTCELCNVVCNSELVFMFHLAGQKHLAMLKKGSVGPQIPIAT